MQGQNIARGVLPWSRENSLRDHRAAAGLLALFVLASAIGFAATRPPPLRVVWIVACLSGPLWLALMRNLAAFHPYTAMYLFPLALVFFAALLHAIPARLRAVAAMAACALLLVSTMARNRELAATAKPLTEESSDLDRIAAVLRPGEAVAVDRRLFRGVPFAPGYYLPGHDLLVEGPADLVLTGSRRVAGENLTPDNLRVFLIRPATRYRARSPLSRFLPAAAAAQEKGRNLHGARSSPDARARKLRP